MSALEDPQAQAEAPNPWLVDQPTPRCPFCGAAFYECVTDYRGLCVKGSNPR